MDKSYFRYQDYITGKTNLNLPTLSTKLESGELKECELSTSVLVALTLLENNRRLSLWSLLRFGSYTLLDPDNPLIQDPLWNKIENMCEKTYRFEYDLWCFGGSPKNLDGHYKNELWIGGGLADMRYRLLRRTMSESVYQGLVNLSEDSIATLFVLSEGIVTKRTLYTSVQ